MSHPAPLTVCLLVLAACSSAPTLQASTSRILQPGPTRLDLADTPNGMFGYKLASGDVNGDGYIDLFISAPNADGDVGAEGRVFGFFGGPQGYGPTADWQADPADAAGAGYGSGLVFLGDIHGDGFGDLLATAPQLRAGTSPGAWFVHAGGPQGPGAPTLMLPGQSGAAKLLGATAAGDVDGDGLADAAVSRTNVGAAGSEVVAVYRGSPQGLVDPVDMLGPRGETSFPRSTIADLASAGDVDGDGYADLIVTLSGYRDLQGVRGVACVYHGSAQGMERAPRWVSDLPVDPDGRAIHAGTGVGDVNGDGYADVTVSDILAGGDRGQVSLFLGGPGGLATAAAWTWRGEPRSWFGQRVASAGDVNADGYGDVLVGSPSAAQGFAADMGHAWLFLGSSGGLSPAPAWESGPPAAEPWQVLFGSAVGAAGDINGDGVDDVVIAAEQGEGDMAGNEGSVWLFSSAPEPVEEPGNTADEDQDGTIACFADRDGDGFPGHGSLALSADNDCSDPGEALTQGAADCHDGDATVHPGGAEVAGNNLDEDCDGHTLCFEDHDRDLRTSGATVTSANADCRDPGEVITGEPDCDDQDPMAWIGAPGACAAGPELQLRWIDPLHLEVTATGSPPGRVWTLSRSVAGPGAGPCPPALAGACSGLIAPVVVPYTRQPDANGAGAWVLTLPRGLSGQRAWLQAWAIGPGSAASTEVVETVVP